MDSALNRAHQLERKAILLFRDKKFDEAIECHEQTADLLKEAMQLTNVDQALESLQLQYNYNINRKKVIRYKQNLLEKVKELNQQVAKLAMENVNFKAGSKESSGVNTSANIAQIYRYLEETDSLLRNLATGELVTGDFVAPRQKELLQMNILPQTDKIIIEELKINNNDLRNLVDQLSLDLEQSREDNKKLKLENEYLKKQMQKYEMERSKPTTNTSSSSPFVVSPSGDLSPDIFHTIANFPPLEMPNFDFHNISSSTEDEGVGNP